MCFCFQYKRYFQKTSKKQQLRQTDSTTLILESVWLSGSACSRFHLEQPSTLLFHLEQSERRRDSNNRPGTDHGRR
jgi:hypothetical protein